MNSTVDTINTVVGAGREVTLKNGDKVQVRVCNGKTLPKLIMFMSGAATDLGLSLAKPEEIKEALLQKLDNVGFLLQLIAKYTEQAYEIIYHLSTMESASAVSDLELDDLTALAIRVVEVNRDFFIEKVMPMFEAAQARTAGQPGSA